MHVVESLIYVMKESMDMVSDHKGDKELKEPDAQTLRSLMKEARISRQEVAELLHVNTNVVSAWVSSADTSLHRPMPLMAWELLLLKLNRHPSKRVFEL